MPPEARKSSAGSARGLETGKEGPRPRTITRRGSGPVMMNALSMIASAVPTTAPEESDAHLAIPGVGLGVRLGVGVGVGVVIGVDVEVAVAVGVGVAIGVDVEVAVAVGLGVGVAMSLS